MCVIMAQVAEQLKAYRPERITARSSVTDKENVTKSCMFNDIIHICEIMNFNCGASLLTVDFIVVVKYAC